ncbi:PREDICTED: nebulin-related-anchoring protein [Hipposideros armiger]|uniref:Nebulin-related-anchoring protein n=1 Tax=Hipposideros armiger TaxID=186990 RepID=A0A8B7RM06_HIPAR|nr:PREDICTED: nebulin-related-anchoring protein [Hipposideros armiger]
MNVQACSRCGYGVYPAEKISCLDQIWHKACFHCEVCKMMLSVNNFVSHQKKPYCHASTQQGYLEEYDQHRGKGSFPAMITPAYQNAKKANELASDVSVRYTEDYEQQRGKGSFPALITPAYQIAKRANELASDVRYHQQYEREIKGMAGPAAGAEGTLTKEYVDQYGQNKYKENYQNHVRGRYEGVGMDKRTLHAMKVGSLASNVTYKADYKHDVVDYNYPATLTPSYQTTVKLVPLKDVNYRQSIDKLKYSSVTNTPQIIQAKINAQQLSHVNYRADYEKNKLNYTLPQDVPQLVKAKTNAELFSEVKYKEGWEKTKGKGFEMKLDAMSLLAAKASGELASNIKYKEEYEKTKGKVMGTTDSRLLHSLQVAKMSSEVEYKKGFEESKTHFHLPMDMVNITHAKKAQALASDVDYRKKLHEYTVLPEDMKTRWAKKAYGLQSELQYRADLAWMKGVGWLTEGSLNLEQAKKAGQLVSEKNYRQRVDEMKFTSVADSAQMEHAKKSQELQSGVVYKAGHEQSLHQYSISKDEPVFLQARANAANLSEKLYKSSWENQKAKGFELRLDSLAFLAAKAKRDLASEVKYKEDYERSRGKLLGAKGAQGDSQMSHSLQMSKLQSELEYKKGFEDTRSQCHVSLDMLHLVHARRAQHLATDIGYKTASHHFTALPTDMKVEWAKKAYGLQSDNQYRADVKWMKGTGWVATGSLNVEQAKKAGELISEKKYRQHPDALKFTSIKDTPEMVQARISYTQAVDRLYKAAGEDARHQYTMTLGLPEFVRAKTNAANLSDAKYQESWRNLRAQGYKLTIDALPFQAARVSGDIASDFLYRHDFAKERGRLIGVRSVNDDPRLQHCQRMGQLQSEHQYRREAVGSQAQCHLPMDMVHLVHARKAQALASDHDYRTQCHEFTALPEDLKMACAKKAHALQSESKYRQHPQLFKYTAVTDTPSLLQAKLSNQLTNERLYKEQGENIKHHYTQTADIPEVLLAKLNAMNISETRYKESWSKLRDGGYKLRLDAIPFQAAKASGEIISDLRYKSDLTAMKGTGWLALSSPQIESAKKAGELVSETKYRKRPDSIKFTSVVDSPDLVHAKNSYMHCNERLYRLGDAESLHRYTLIPDHPDFIRARLNALHLSDKVYRNSWEQTRAGGYDFRLDAIPFQTARASREIASDFRYREAFLRDRGLQIGYRSINDDPRMRHFLSVGKLQSDNEYRKDFAKSRSQFHSRPDQPGFLQAKRSQQLASDVRYRQPLPQPTCDPEQLGLKHAQKAHQLQSDVKYKSDLNLTRGIGWTPPGSYKVEMARRAAELANARSWSPQGAYGGPEVVATGDNQRGDVNPDAAEILHVKRRKALLL